jgi:hypothetical protein
MREHDAPIRGKSVEFVHVLFRLLWWPDMSAIILPFPPSRRRRFIERQAEIVLGCKPKGAVQYLDRQIAIQADAMRRKGIDEPLIDAECTAMRAAIDAEVHRWLNYVPEDAVL